MARTPNHNPLATVELYNPSSNKWAIAPSLPVPVYRTSAVVLHDSRVLVAGGTQGPPFGFAGGVSASELYDPSSNTWTVGPVMPAAVSAWNSTVLLHSGNVLIAGGDNNGAVAASEVYLPTF